MTSVLIRRRACEQHREDGHVMRGQAAVCWGPSQGTPRIARNSQVPGEARKAPSLERSEGTVLQGDPGHLRQHRLLPFPCISGSVSDSRWDCELLQYGAQGGLFIFCYLALAY